MIVVIVASMWWRNAKEQKNREAEQTERILNADLNTMVDEDLSDLGKKYSDGGEENTVKADEEKKQLPGQP